LPSLTSARDIRPSGGCSNRLTLNKPWKGQSTSDQYSCACGRWTARRNVVRLASNSPAKRDSGTATQQRSPRGKQKVPINAVILSHTFYIAQDEPQGTPHKQGNTAHKAPAQHNPYVHRTSTSTRAQPVFFGLTNTSDSGSHAEGLRHCQYCWLRIATPNQPHMPTNTGEGLQTHNPQESKERN
jgi:hypothetical protein